MFLILDYVTWLSMHFQTISTSFMNKMGLKYSLSITTLTIWLWVIFFFYGPDVIIEFCYKTVKVSYEVVGFLKFILRCDWVDKKNCKWTWLVTLPVTRKSVTANICLLWSGIFKGLRLQLSSQFRETESKSHFRKAAILYLYYNSISL